MVDSFDFFLKVYKQSNLLNLNLPDLLIEYGCTTLLSFEFNFLAHCEYYTITNLSTNY